MDKQSLEGTLRQYISSSINKTFTSIPAIIESVRDLGEQRIDVRILIDKVTTSGETESHPIILNVPLIFPSSISSMFSFPVAVGDDVLLVFSQRSLDRLKMSTGATPLPPKNYRKYSRNDAIALPGFFSFSEARNNPNKRRWSHDTQDMVMAHNIGTAQEAEVRIKPNGDISINTVGNVTINCSNAVVNSDTTTVNSGSTTVNSDTTTVNSETTINGNTNINGNLTVGGGSMTHNGTDIGSGHTHNGVEKGDRNTGTPN